MSHHVDVGNQTQGAASACYKDMRTRVQTVSTHIKSQECWEVEAGEAMGLAGPGAKYTAATNPGAEEKDHESEVSLGCRVRPCLKT